MLIDLREQGDAALDGVRRVHRRRRRRRPHAGAAADAARAQRLPAGKRRPRLRAADAGSVPRRERRHALLRPRPVAPALLRRHARHLGRSLRAARSHRFRAPRLGAAQRMADRPRGSRSVLPRRARAIRAGRVQLRARHLAGAGHRAARLRSRSAHHGLVALRREERALRHVALEGPASTAPNVRIVLHANAVHVQADPERALDPAHRGAPARRQGAGSEGAALRARLRRDRERAAAARLERRRSRRASATAATRSAAISWSIPPAGSAGCTRLGRTRCGTPSRSASCRPAPRSPRCCDWATPRSAPRARSTASRRSSCSALRRSACRSATGSTRT